jgi:hypothetical protein
MRLSAAGNQVFGRVGIPVLLEAVLRRYPAVKSREERTMKKARMDDDEPAGSCAA